MRCNTTTPELARYEAKQNMKLDLQEQSDDDERERNDGTLNVPQTHATRKVLLSNTARDNFYYISLKVYPPPPGCDSLANSDFLP